MCRFVFLPSAILCERGNYQGPKLNDVYTIHSGLVHHCGKFAFHNKYTPN